MGFFDLFRSSKAEPAGARPLASADAFSLSLDDPRLAAFLRDGETEAGATVNASTALRNMAVFRCVDIISSTIGMLPMYLMEKTPSGELRHAQDHQLYDLLLHKPNAWQSAQQFRTKLQMDALTQGNGYALIVRSVGKPKQLVPLDPWRTTPRQNSDWTLTYRYTKPDGGSVDYSADDILHIRGLSSDGILGISRTNVAREAISLALQTEKAAARLFRNGMMVGGVITHPGKLSKAAFDNLRDSLSERYAGAENAHKNMLFEEGMTYKEVSATAANSQHIETRKMQIEEVARAFGVPRPLLMMDDTSWGSGIEQLAILFVRFGLAPWFGAWEGAIKIALLSPKERQTLSVDIDEKELLRGSMADQAAFYSAALGSGGHAPWMTQNEVRDDVGLGPHDDGNGLINPMTATKAPNPPGAANDG